MFKKMSYVLLCAFFISALFSIPAFAAVEQQHQQVQDVLNVNGTITKLNQPLLEIGGIVYLPMTEAFSRIGGRVGWNAASGLVTASYLDHRIVLKPDSREAALDGKEITLANPTIIREGRTYVPLNFFSRLGFIATLQKDDLNKIRYCYLHKPSYAFKFVQGDLYRATLKEPAADYAYILNYPESVTTLRFVEEGDVYKDILFFDQSKAAVSETLRGYSHYNRNEGVIYDAGKAIFQVGREELPNIYKKYTSKKLLSNITTKNGRYGLHEYKNDLEQFIFTLEGKLSGFGDDKEQGLFLAKDNKVLVAAKLGNDLGKLQQYIVSDEDYLFVINAGGYLVEENRLHEKIYQPKYLDLQKKDAYAVLGSARSLSGNYRKIQGEVFGLDKSKTNSTSFVLEVPGAADLEITQVLLADKKIIFQARDGLKKYLGYYELNTHQKDLHRLPDWVKDAEIIGNAAGEFLLCRDAEHLYVQQLDFTEKAMGDSAY